MERRSLTFVALLLPIIVLSWIHPFDRLTWWLESIPALVGCVLIVFFGRRFPLSTLLLALLWLHCVILLVGGHYTYARVPLFDWIREWTGGDRNNYDKLGHFAQGFVPAMLAREILLRRSPLGSRDIVTGALKASRWIGFLAVSICLAFSALYELVEWWTAVAQGSAADEFLGTQGYVWDTQSDMCYALVGAIVAMLLLPRLHDRSLAALEARGVRLIPSR